MKVAEERSTSNAVARDGQGGREQVKADMDPSHRFKPKGLCACRCSFVHRQL